MSVLIARRSFLAGFASILAAPAIVKADALMRVGNIDYLLYPMRGLIAYDIQTDEFLVRIDRANFQLRVPSVGRGVEYVMTEKEIKTLIPKYHLDALIPRAPFVPIKDGDKILHHGMQQKHFTIAFSPSEWQEKGLLPPCPRNV